MFKKTLVALYLLAVAGTARAQPAGPVGVTAVLLPDTDAGEIFKKGTLGFSFPVTLLSNLASPGRASAAVPTVNVLYFLSPKAAVDLVVGINIHHSEIADNSTPPMTITSTVFGIAGGVGYRMYTHKSGKLHSYLEPSGLLSWGDTASAAAFSLRLAAALGAEREITEWFTFSGAIGGALDLGNKLKDIQLTPTASLAANFYWK